MTCQRVAAEMLTTLGILCVLQIIAAQVRIQPKPLTGQNLVVICSFPENTMAIVLSVRGRDITTIGSKFLGLLIRGSTAVEYRYGPLEASDDGAVFECNDQSGNTNSTTLELLGEIIDTQNMDCVYGE